MQHAIDPKADAQVILLRLDVDVGGPLLGRLRDDQVHDLDDRRVLLDVLQAARHWLRLQRLLEGTDILIDAGAQLVGLGDRSLNLRAHAQQGFDAFAGEHLELGEQRQVAGVDGGDLEHVLLEANGQDGVLTGIGFGDQCQRVLVDARAGEVDLRYVEVHAEDGGKRLLVDHPLGEQHLAERPVLAPLRGQRILQLLGGE